MSLAVAKRYASALVDVIVEPGAETDPRAAAGQLREFENLLRESAELRTALLSPAVAPSRKRSVVARLAESLGVSPLVRNFLFVVIDRRRIGMFGQIRRAFEDLLDERLGVLGADVTSARELTGRQQAALRERLARMTEQAVRCEHKIDETLLGGAVVQIKSTVYDGSVRGQLELLRHRLTE